MSSVNMQLLIAFYTDLIITIKIALLNSWFYFSYTTLAFTAFKWRVELLLFLVSNTLHFIHEQPAKQGNFLGKLKTQTEKMVLWTS